LHETMASWCADSSLLRTASSPRKDHQSEYSAALFHCARQVGKAVEFGLSWGLHDCARFILATMASDKTELTDSTYAVGRSRISSRYSKGAARLRLRSWWYSAQNVERLGKLGVRNIGLAPGTRALGGPGKVRDRLIRERALVEGSIGTIKCNKYGFNRPAARSAAMMACVPTCSAWPEPYQAASGAAGRRECPAV